MAGRIRNGGKWGLTPLATTTVVKAITPVATEGQTPFSPFLILPPIRGFF